ncbi:MAG TPA: stage II sporulation protein M [Methylomusa anaerophila]|uniref:Stage II sporulation protein M n=1 Tax=Methylomusa anaerophila TaxID=1930071 RepID=A0A348APD7_9FIRM|nr:stage II sporulation protein M [Methylomusa anaerophila]BBB92935.1 stage II sporulation protein M [Methylomusa anaerophila]HML87231.1 stage II sporulation protein M [Methylomusa anaerophila]
MNLLRKYIAEYIRTNIVAYFFITLIFVIGVVAGAMAVKTLPEEQKLELVGYLRIFFQGLAQQQGLTADSQTLLFTAIINNAKVIILMWLLGFTVVGIPFVLLLVWVRGFVIGFTVGFLVNEYVLKGLLFAIVSVLPHNFFTVPAILATGVAATTYSLLLVRRRSSSKHNLLYISFSYCIFCFIMMVITVVGSLIEVYVSPVFMKIIVSLMTK